MALRSAYESLVNIYRPDDPEAAQKLSEISEAYEVIGDDKLRRAYDKAWMEARTRRSPSSAARCEADKAA
eukprot:764374-Hanusia_phi.AAC.2